MLTIKYEHTDTFGGEANYSWVTRGEVEFKNERDIVRQVKKALGMSGVKCDREEWSGMIVLKPRGICQIIFIGESL